MTSRLAPTRLPVLLAALFALAACTQEAPAPTPSPAPVTTTTPAPETAPGVTPPAAGTAQTPRTPGPVLPPRGPAPVPGTDYVEIPGGQPYQPGTDKIEVVEVFGYTCPACASFEPLVSAWAAKLPADVEFAPVAAPFGGYWMPYAKAFYTAQAMGLVDATHDAMFHAIHVDRSLPVQPPPTDEQLAQFYAKHGADPEQFLSTMQSFAINAKMKRAQQFLMNSGVESTPTMLVNGKYRVTARGFDEVLRVTEHLIAQERAEAGTAPAAADAPAGG